jgi:hypothetical protein
LVLFQSRFWLTSWKQFFKDIHVLITQNLGKF